MFVLSPLNVKRFDKTQSIYINHTHLIHSLHFSICEHALCEIKKIFLSQTENLEPPKLSSSSMASSSATQETGSSNQKAPVYDVGTRVFHKSPIEF